MKVSQLPPPIFRAIPAARHKRGATSEKNAAWRVVESRCTAYHSTRDMYTRTSAPTRLTPLRTLGLMMTSYTMHSSPLLSLSTEGGPTLIGMFNPSTWRSMPEIKPFRPVMREVETVAMT